MNIDKKLLKKARQILEKHNNYSISFLQRNLEVGYNRAAVLMEIIKKEQKRRIRLYSKKKKKFRYGG